jgi:polysaccharide transporter, PST family
MTLLRTSVFSAFAVLTRLSVSIYLNKIIALIVGPAGFALIGQFQSLISAVTAFGGGAVQVGVTKYTAEYADDPVKRDAVWSAALAVSLVASAAIGTTLVLARHPIARAIFGNDDYADVVAWLAAALVFIGLNGLYLAILNGRKALRHLVAANVAGSLVGAALSTVLVIYGGLHGTLIALALSPACACGITWLVFRRVANIRWNGLRTALAREPLQRLLGYALMAGTTAVVVPFCQVWTRNAIAAEFGWSFAGYWQALWKVSETHLLLLTSVLSVYFLPRLSEIRSGGELRTEVRAAYRVVVPLAVVSATLLFLMREPLIGLLLSPKFEPIAHVLGIQLLGDVLKICSWVMSFTMVSHARTRAFVITEILFAALTAIGIVVLTHFLGLRGAAIAYAAVYLVYWATMWWLFESLASRLDRAAAAERTNTQLAPS